MSHNFWACALEPRSHNFWACALEPRSHNYCAHVPQLLKPLHLRACAPQQEKQPPWETCTPQLESSPRATTETSTDKNKNIKLFLKNTFITLEQSFTSSRVLGDILLKFSGWFPNHRLPFAYGSVSSRENIDSPRCESRFCHLLAVQPQASYLRSLCLRFLNIRKWDKTLPCLLRLLG